MSCVSMYCTIHKDNLISFSRQKRELPWLTCLIFYTDRLHLFFKKLFTAQYKTAIQHVFEAVT